MTLVVCERINGFVCYTQGFQRVYDELPEINLDVPHAHSIMETFVDLCYQESVITKQLRDFCPTRLETFRRLPSSLFTDVLSRIRILNLLVSDI